MEAAPPTYEAATLTNHWDLVAPYIDLNDLCSCALVCKRWHGTFTPHIWGNPASHFGLNSDAVYDALSRFMRALRTARLSVRTWTHTLHLPSAGSDLYHGLGGTWLKDVLENLPNLQSLIVRGLPLLDHGALQAVASLRRNTDEDFSLRSGLSGLSVSSPLQIPPAAMTTFSLRLLDASRCMNATPSGLSVVLGRFENLIYLDLSFSPAARNPGVLQMLEKSIGLQVLKLRGINLRDESFEVLCRAIGHRARSLDLRENEVTDRGVKTLLHYCFVDSDGPSRGQISSTRAELLPQLGAEMLEIYQGEDFEGYLRKTFTGGFVNRLAIEDTPSRGVTHLYISGNQLTVEGISSLVRTGRLHVLDVGSQRPVPGIRTNERSWLEAQNLTPLLATYASGPMKFLRIDHGLVTGDNLSASGEPADPGSAEVGATTEMDGKSDIGKAYGMPIERQPPRYEFSSQSSEPEQFTSQAERSGPDTVTENAQSAGSPASSATMTTEPASGLQNNSTASHNFHPSMLPQLATLVLTDVPPFSLDSTIAERLISFITHCAEQASFARQQAVVDYSVPPGRRGTASALKHSASKTFALRRLVLELASQRAPSGAKSGHWLKGEEGNSKSMTEDRDSEAFWSASEKDFTFFGGREESFLSTIGMDQVDGQSGGMTKGVGHVGSSSDSLKSSDKLKVDNIALISAFRQERKLTRQQRIEVGGDGGDVEGLWDGVVSVVRNNGSGNEDEHLDYYEKRPT